MRELHCTPDVGGAGIAWAAADTGRGPAAEPRYGIAALARHFGVSLRTLRFYESKGLVTPRRSGKERSYSAADRERLALILKGKKLGFTLTEIGQMIAAQEGRAEPSQADLRISRRRCRDQIALVERQIAELQEALAELRRIDHRLSQEEAAGGG